MHGEIWEFYIIFGEYEKNVWGPITGISGFTRNISSPMDLVSILRRIVDFIKDNFITKLINTVTVVGR